MGLNSLLSLRKTPIYYLLLGNHLHPYTFPRRSSLIILIEAGHQIDKNTKRKFQREKENSSLILMSRSKACGLGRGDLGFESLLLTMFGCWSMDKQYEADFADHVYEW